MFETGLPVRTYIPKTDVRLEYLKASDLVSACPYKVRLRLVSTVHAAETTQGVASYYDIELPSGPKLEGLVWWYRNPSTECADIKGYVAFYDEKVDVFLDGQKAPRPRTHLT
jgi:uncharacterized protein (DUF427 family)